MQRGVTLEITKEVSNQTLPGYPKSYSVLVAFSVNGRSYGVLTETQLQQLSVTDYTNRLSDFKDYVEAAEGIVSVDAVTESGYEAYRENTTSCPIGV